MWESGHSNLTIPVVREIHSLNKLVSLVITCYITQESILVPGILDGSRSRVNNTCQVTVKAVGVTGSLLVHTHGEQFCCVPIISIETVGKTEINKAVNIPPSGKVLRNRLCTDSSL